MEKCLRAVVRVLWKKSFLSLQSRLVKRRLSESLQLKCHLILKSVYIPIYTVFIYIIMSNNISLPVYVHQWSTYTYI